MLGGLLACCYVGGTTTHIVNDGLYKYVVSNSAEVSMSDLVFGLRLFLSTLKLVLVFVSSLSTNFTVDDMLDLTD